MTKSSAPSRLDGIPGGSNEEATRTRPANHPVVLWADGERVGGHLRALGTGQAYVTTESALGRAVQLTIELRDAPATRVEDVSLVWSEESTEGIAHRIDFTAEATERWLTFLSANQVTSASERPESRRVVVLPAPRNEFEERIVRAFILSSLCDVCVCRSESAVLAEAKRTEKVVIALPVSSPWNETFTRLPQGDGEGAGPARSVLFSHDDEDSGRKGRLGGPIVAGSHRLVPRLIEEVARALGVASRAQKRWILCKPCQIVTPSGDQLTGEIADVSESGARIVMREAIAIGEPVRLAFRMDEAFDLRCIPLHSERTVDGRHAIGLFIDEPPQAFVDAVEAHAQSNGRARSDAPIVAEKVRMAPRIPARKVRIKVRLSRTEDGRRDYFTLLDVSSGGFAVRATSDAVPCYEIGERLHFTLVFPAGSIKGSACAVRHAPNGVSGFRFERLAYEEWRKLRRLLSDLANRGQTKPTRSVPGRRASTRNH